MKNLNCQGTGANTNASIVLSEVLTVGHVSPFVDLGFRISIVDFKLDESLILGKQNSKHSLNARVVNFEIDNDCL